jgi:hypothetical protein
VFVDPETGDFYLQGETVTDPGEGQRSAQGQRAYACLSGGRARMACYRYLSTVIADGN